MPSIKNYLSILPEFVQNLYHSYKKSMQISKWKRQGCPIPPPHTIKEALVLEYKNKHQINTLVETGTYLGDMVWAQRHEFEQIYSIELSKEFAHDASKRFKKYPHIQIIQGDSGKVMENLIPQISEKTIFWLDAHFSGGTTARGDKDCPAAEEIKAIMTSDLEHILIIDDARYFIGERDYPTVEWIAAYTLNTFPNRTIREVNDCIIIELLK